MSNLFKIPRTKFAQTDARWALVRKFGTSRKSMVNFITGIGGYISRHGQYAIEFSIAAYNANLDATTLWETLVTKCDFGIDKMPVNEQVIAEHLFRAAHAEHETHLWNWGVEEAFESWSDSDSPYETFEGTRVDWKFEVQGRGGKHLVMTECEGINLQRSPESLEEALMERDSSGDYEIPIDWVKKLFIICAQNTVELTPTAIGHEVEYRAAWRLWASFCEDELPAAVTAYHIRARLADDAGSIRDILASEGTSFQQDVFKTICLLAGVQLKE